MIVKSNKDNYIMVIASFIIILFVYVIGFYEMGIFGIVFTCILVILTSCYWIAITRTIVMDESGCMVCFLWYKKKYKWSDLKIKQIRKCKNAPTRMYPYPFKKCVVFSPRAIHKPRWYGFLEYNIFFRPFSLIVMFFISEERVENEFYCIYQVDEASFRENMQNWNVELEESDITDLMW